MSSDEVAAKLVLPGETFRKAPRRAIWSRKRADVFYIVLPKVASSQAVSRFHYYLSLTNHRIIVHVRGADAAWQTVFNKLDYVILDLDDHTVLIDKTI